MHACVCFIVPYRLEVHQLVYCYFCYRSGKYKEIKCCVLNSVLELALSMDFALAVYFLAEWVLLLEATGEQDWNLGYPDRISFSTKCCLHMLKLSGGEKRP